MGAVRFAVGCFAASLPVACGLDVNGLEATSQDAGVGIDATADVGHATDGSAEASGGDSGTPPEDSATDAPTVSDVVVTEAAPADGCVATGAESCTNGVDDDCNGLVDCADPACGAAGYACVVPAPGGWDFVGFDATSQTGCAGTLAQKKVDVDPTNLTAPAQCGCTCGLTANPACAQGNISAKHGADSTCGPGGPVNYPANNGACNGTPLTVDVYVQATQPPAMGGTCTASESVTRPSTGATQGEVCGGEKAFGAGCTGGQVCALVPSPFQQCIHHGGAATCPAGSPYATAHAVGTLQDNRGCTNCACAPPTCGTGHWSFYQSNNCSGAVTLSLTTDGLCDATGYQMPSPPFPSNEFVPGPPGCAVPTQPTPSGSAQLGGADTLCCR